MPAHRVGIQPEQTSRRPLPGVRIAGAPWDRRPMNWAAGELLVHQANFGRGFHSPHTLHCIGAKYALPTKTGVRLGDLTQTLPDYAIEGHP